MLARPASRFLPFDQAHRRRWFSCLTRFPPRLSTVRRQTCSSLYGSLQGRPLRLAILRQRSLEAVGPFSSRAALQRALDKIVPPDSSMPESQPSPGQLFDALVSAVAELGSRWSRVLLVGNLPALDPAVVDYSSARLLRAFMAQQVRVSWLAPAGGNDAWLPLFQAAGGTIERAGIEDFGRQRDTGQHFSLLNWTPSAPGAGFITSRSVLSDQSRGTAVLEVPDLAAPLDFSLPTVEVYSGMQSKIAEAEAALKEPAITQSGLQGVRSQLAAALAINPLEPAALRLGVELYEKAGDFATAVKFGTTLKEVRPLDGSAYAALGHALWLSSDLAKCRNRTEARCRTECGCRAGSGRLGSHPHCAQG